MSNVTISYMTKDQNYQNEETIYWFSVEGSETFDGEYGVVESGCDESNIVDSEGHPIDGYADEQPIRQALQNAVTDEMRAE